MILLIAVVLQAALLTWQLQLLDLWTDELSLEFVVAPLRQLIGIAASDVHPPLYYLLQHFWLAIPLPMTDVAQMRLLSVLFCLGATVAIDRLWLRERSATSRKWFLALWVASPCLLMYARMGRSYSLQVLSMVLAVWCAREVARREEPRRIWQFSGAALLCLYVHYVIGIALLAATGLVLLWQRRWKAIGWIAAAIAVGYLPWAAMLVKSLGTWTRQGAPYKLTGALGPELVLKAGYGALAFTGGETQPDAGLIAAMLLFPALVWLGWLGWRTARIPKLILAIVAGIGFVGVAQWVAYPFIPARVLFLFPFLLLLVVEGIAIRPAIGRWIGAAWLLLCLTGMVNYFGKANFLNKGYAMPFAEIAATIRSSSNRTSTAVLCDEYNTDFRALRHYLGSAWDVPLLYTPAASTLAADPRIRTLWILRNTHDISPAEYNTRFEQQLAASWRVSRHYYLPFSPLQRKLAALAGIQNPPQFFQVLTEFRR